MQLKYKENQEWKSILDLYNKEELPIDNALYLIKRGEWVDINKYPIQKVQSQPNESLLTFSLNDKTYNYSIGDLVMYNEDFYKLYNIKDGQADWRIQAKSKLLRYEY